MSYDSKADTLEHIRKVNTNLMGCIAQLVKRAVLHDQSKLQSPEKEGFDKMTPILKDLEYGSEEYKASLAELGVTLKHHYEHNSHHPEHYENGIAGMDLFDLVEMYCDWKAASERTKDGDLRKSIEINSNRFKMDEQLVSIFNNTINKI